MLNNISIENYNLFLEVDKRMKNATDNDFISSDDVLSDLDVTMEQLNSLEEVEIE